MLEFIADENGATAIEYGLIAALIAVAIIGSLTVLQQSLIDNFDEIADRLRYSGDGSGAGAGATGSGSGFGGSGGSGGTFGGSGS